MNLNVKNKMEKIVVAITGTIDNNTVNEFSEKMNEIDIENNDIILDFDGVTYITSAGLRSLLILVKRVKDKSFEIINVNNAIEDIFKMTGFDKILNYSLKNESISNENFITLLNDRINDNKDKVICTYIDKEYTWGDLDVASHIVANDLYKMGVKKGTHVGICSYNSPNWIIVFLAVQKLGGIAVLINSLLKPVEMNDICMIGGTEYLCFGSASSEEDYNLYMDELLNKIGSSVKAYNIASYINFFDRKDIYNSIKDSYREIHNCDDPSVIIFTSGSSGKPKAVLASSFNLTEPVNHFLAEYDFTDDDKSCAFLPFFHIFGLCSQIIFSLMMNAPLYIPSNNKPSSIVDVIDKYKCTIFHTVPTMMLAIAMDKDFKPERLSTLRLSILGGSSTTEEQMRLLQKLLPNNHFANMYGMSENAIISSTRYVDTVEHLTQTVGVTPPYLDIQIREIGSDKVLNKNETGEICIRSKTMIVCYYNLDISKQPIGADGFLRTGDLGYIDDDGYVVLNGRVKELIIRGGENISPNEVCNSIVKLDIIADAKVIGVPHKLLGEEVAAAVVLKDNKVLTKDVRDELAKSMANYKIPTYFVVFDRLPLLGSGKIDSIKLKEMMIQKINNKEYI